MAPKITPSAVKLILLACEAGMGSSLMSVNALKKKLKAANVTGVVVQHIPARTVTPDVQLVVVHRGLSKLVRSKAPNAVVVAFDHFLNDPAFDRLVNAFVTNTEIVSNVE